MKWTKKQIINIVMDLAEENAFACRALFKISEIIFTSQVKTLAVSISSSPELKINLSFLSKHAGNENDVKALLMHEFLHVILMHTEKFTFNTPLLNIALDAIINSIIHRTYGEKYSDFFTRFYPDHGIVSLLCPITKDSDRFDSYAAIKRKIYEGKFAADDLYELLEYLQSKDQTKDENKVTFIGNHDFDKKPTSPQMKKLMNEIRGKMKGTGIWNKSVERGCNYSTKNEASNITKYNLKHWRTGVYAILKKCLTEDSQKPKTAIDTTVMIPVISSHDRRALSTYSWSGIIPLTKNIVTSPVISESVNIYLDVSGSMAAEIEQIILMLDHFRNHIKKPLWVFSNEVNQASFKHGKLIYKSSGGTSISCVFDHIRAKGFKKNLIVTDGYTEDITDAMLEGVDPAKIWAIVSAYGSAWQFEKHHLKYHQLKQLPT
jgi:hypothetical protein